MLKKQLHVHLSSNRLLLVSLVVLTLCFVLWAKGAAAADLVVPESTTILAHTGGPSGAKDCSNSRTYRVPLTDMARMVYGGFTGGLYPSSNEVPAQHLQMGMAASQRIEPLDTQGHPDSSGKIVFLAVGMSNVRQEFDKFMELVQGQTSAPVVLENGAKGGYDAVEIANPNSDYWGQIDDHLLSRNLSRFQVQAIWLKEAVAGEDDPFPQDAQQLQNYLRAIVLIAKNRYPNLEAIYFSSRTYGGYGEPNSASPEPWAYQGGFAVKWLIESQIDGSDPALAYNNSPWLAWGPYLWADGLNPRSDGLIWKCSDFEDDGVHPSPAGELKAANLLLNFFSEDATTQWFLNSKGVGTKGARSNPSD